MEIAFLWFALSVVAGIVAAAKGRTGVGYFLLALVLSPLVGLILAAALPRIDGGDLRNCPECAEPIRRAARRCKHCGASVEPLPQEPSGAYRAGYERGKNWRVDRHNR